jgi:hypothetical protein
MTTPSVNKSVSEHAGAQPVRLRQVTLRLTETALVAADYGAEKAGLSRDDWISRVVWEAALELDRCRAVASERLVPGP